MLFRDDSISLPNVQEFSTTYSCIIFAGGENVGEKIWGFLV